MGADFSMDIEIGDDTFTKKPNVLEELAYRDTWGKGADSFIAMIYERLVLMRDLLAGDGSIYVHCDWRVSAFLRLILDEVFTKDFFQNEIIWKRASAHNFKTKGYVRNSENVFYYTRDANAVFNDQYTPYGEAQLSRYKDRRERQVIQGGKLNLFDSKSEQTI